MSCRTGLGLLVLTFGLTFAGVSSAQGDDAQPPPGGAPPPAAQPAPVPGAQPAPVAGQPSQQPPPTAFGETATVGPVEEEEAEEPAGLPPRVPWRGSRIDWISAITTTSIGVGRDNISDSHESAAMLWLFKLNYYVVDQDDWRVQVSTTPGFWVELTNSDFTTTEHEPLALDLPVLGSLGYTLFSDGLWSTSAGYTTGLVFPLSPLSHDAGTVLNTTNRLSLSQGIPILGEDSPVLKSLSLFGMFRWDHRFSRATTAVNDDLNRPRQNAAGFSQLDDQLSGGALAHDTLREVLSIGFSEAVGHVPINVSFDFLFSQQFKYGFDDSGGGCDVQTLTGCVAAPAQSDEIDQNQFYYGFGTSIEVLPTPELGVTLAYSSSSSPLGQNTLAPDGTHQDFLYAPDAEFSGTLTFYPDALYERIIGPPRQLAEAEKKRAAF